MSKSTFLESMKTGPRSTLELNYDSAKIMGQLLTQIRPNHIIVHTSYSKINEEMSQQIWSLGSLLFVVSLIGENGEVDNRYSECLICGNEFEQFISKNINSDSKYIYNCVGLKSKSSIATDKPIRGFSQDPPEENFGMSLI